MAPETGILQPRARRTRLPARREASVGLPAVQLQTELELPEIKFHLLWAEGLEPAVLF